MKTSLFISFLTLISSFSFPQDISKEINGSVFHKKTEMIGASVSILDSNLGTVSDIDGAFALKPSNLPEGPVTVLITYAYYPNVYIAFDSLEEALSTSILVTYKNQKKFKVTKTPE